MNVSHHAGRSAVATPASADAAPIIMYLCYGAEQICRQAIFSILSLLRVTGEGPRDFRLIVYCDRPDLFERLPVEVVEIDTTTLDLWLDGSDYVHRRKTCAVLAALERFGGKVIFVDTDTYFTRSPMPLFDRVGPGRACFHILEGFIRSTATTPDRALVRQLEDGEHRLASGKPVVVDARTPMWNTGVVGVDAADIALVREALALSDAIWAAADPEGMDGKKIHHGEQFAMGFAFRDCLLGEAADRVYHYWPWPMKAAFNGLLPDLTASGVADPSPANLDRIFGFRPRQHGVDAARDVLKMSVRRAALSLGLPIRGVRRSVA